MADHKSQTFRDKIGPLKKNAALTLFTFADARNRFPKPQRTKAFPLLYYSDLIPALYGLFLSLSLHFSFIYSEQ